MKLIALAALVGLALMVPAAAVDSARPPALLTFAVTYGLEARPGGICLSRANGANRLRLTGRFDYREPDWSPKGKFLVVRLREELRVLNARGQVVYALPHYIGEYEMLQSNPAWSPDGSRIAYTGGFRTYSSLVVATRSGAIKRILESRYQEGPSSPSWSPHGTRLAYQREGVDQPRSVYTIRVDGSDRRVVVTPAADPDWSPVDSRLAYVDGAGELAVSRTDGSAAVTLTHSPERESNPAWSPDGKLLAFERIDIATGRSWIVVVRSDTGREVSVIRGPYDAHEPSWRAPYLLPKADRPACR